MKQRCPLCGAMPHTWSRPAILAAIKAFHAEHGRAPKHDEWQRSTPEHPSNHTVKTMFGGWRAGITAAGLEPPLRSNQTRHWTEDLVKQAVFEFVYENGRVPTTADWAVCTDRYPSKEVCRRLFGGLSAAVEAAGYSPRRKGLSRRAGQIRVRAKAAA